MKILTTFALVAETSLASVFLGALWLSPLPAMAKISLSCGMVLLALIQDLQGLERSRQSQQQLELTDIAFRVMEKRISNQSAPSLDAAYSDYMKQKHMEAIMGTGGTAQVVSLLLKYSLWVVGALLCKWVVLPPFTVVS
jgi:hypothetical protein